MRWWSSDFHIGHYNVIRYCNRPFVNVHEMTNTIVKIWNSTVSNCDDMMFLGDFSMSQNYLHTLCWFNFNHMYWVLGNHDKANRIKREMDSGGQLSSIRDRITLIEGGFSVFIGDKEFYVTHRPMDGSDTLPTICGHVHEKYGFLPAGTKISEHSRSRPITEKVTKTPILNVGLDAHNMMPINDEQVLRFFYG